MLINTTFVYNVLTMSTAIFNFRTILYVFTSKIKYYIYVLIEITIINSWRGHFLVYIIIYHFNKFGTVGRQWRRQGATEKTSANHGWPTIMAVTVLNQYLLIIPVLGGKKIINYYQYFLYWAAILFYSVRDNSRLQI